MEKRIINTLLPLLVFAGFIMFFLPATSIAQQGAFTPQQENAVDVDEKQIEQFASILQKLVGVQEEFEDKMIQLIEANALDIETFNTIVMALQVNPDGEIEGVTEEQLAAFERVQPKIREMQQELQEKVVELVEEDEMDSDTFQNLFALYQTNPEFQQKVHQQLEE